MKTKHFLKQYEVLQNTVQVLLYPHSLMDFIIAMEQAGYMYYPDLNPFYLCYAATELTNPRMTSAPSIPTSMVNSTSTLSMI